MINGVEKKKQDWEHVSMLAAQSVGAEAQLCFERWAKGWFRDADMATWWFLSGIELTNVTLAS